MSEDKEKRLTADEKAQQAEANFRSGCNCAQSVLLAFSDELHMDEDTLMRLGAPFGGGMGRMREVCGAVTGMMMAYGLLKGYTKTTGDKAAHYESVRQLADAFRAENGSIVCRELLAGVPVQAGNDPEARTPQYYKKRPCPLYCADAARILQTELEKENGQA